jgi:hypothetical protein
VTTVFDNMAKFTRAFRIQGYDRYASPDWQMVPLGGVRYVILRDGAGFNVTSTVPAKCSVVEVTAADLPGDDRQPFEPNDRFFKLTGCAYGVSMIEARNGGSVVKLEASVKRSKTVKIKFILVSDNAGHATTRNASDIARHFATAKWMYREQINVNLNSLGPKSITIAQNLSDAVRFSKHITSIAAGEHEWDLVVANRDNAADLNIFFVWEYEQGELSEADSANAGTLGGNCIFEDDIGAGIPMWRTMSHEIGHHLGVDDFYDDTKKYELMYGHPDRGIHIPKEHANIMNP